MALEDSVMTTPGQERLEGRVASTDNQRQADGPLREFLVRKFLRHHGYVPNLASPNTFSEKILHKI